MRRAAKTSLKTEGTFAAVDIGTTKTVCFIAHLESDGEIRVVGVGHQLSKGIRSGHITDFVEAQTSVVSAVHAAEQMAEQTIENVMVNVSSGHIASRTIHVELSLGGQAVTERDLADVLKEGRESVATDDQVILHAIPTAYALDGAKSIKDPRGMVGELLAADVHFLSAPQIMMKNLTNLFAGCHLNINDAVVAPHASALAVLDPDEMDLGITVIDMGGGTTSYSVFAGGKNIFSDAVALGGAHVTSDLAKGLSTSLVHAERLKTLHGSAIATAADDKAMIEVPQLGEEDADGNLMPRSMLAGIIRPRLEEIFEMIRGKIETAGLDKISGRRVVLTGGASQLIGTRDLATRVLGKQIRLGKPQRVIGLADAVSGPAFATGIGMLEYMRRRTLEDRMLDATRRRAGGMDKIFRWFRENF